MVGVIFPLAFTFLLFFMILCSLIFVCCFCFHVFQTVVWAAKAPYKPAYFFSYWSLNFIIFVIVLLHRIMVYYITKLHYSRLSYYFVIIYLVLFLLFPFYFHVILLLVLLSSFKFYFILFLFYLVFVLLYLLSFYIIIYPA